MIVEPVAPPTRSRAAMRVAAVAVIIGIVMGLLITIQQMQVTDLRKVVTVEVASKEAAIAANTVSQATITTLRAEALRNKAYMADLDKRIRASETKAKKAREDFEELKRKNKPVRDWAAQPLPNGLRGKAPSKPASSDQNKGRAD